MANQPKVMQFRERTAKMKELFLFKRLTYAQIKWTYVHEWGLSVKSFFNDWAKIREELFTDLEADVAKNGSIEDYRNEHRKELKMLRGIALKKGNCINAALRAQELLMQIDGVIKDTTLFAKIDKLEIVDDEDSQDKGL